MTVEVSVGCPAWTADLPEAAEVVERAVRAAAWMSAFGFSPCQVRI